MSMRVKILQPWVDATRLTIEWSRYWLDWSEAICEEIEHG